MHILSYLKNVCNSILNKKILYRMNGVVLYKVQDSLFDLHVLTSREIQAYCKQMGFIIDKVVFITSYDASCFNEDSLDAPVSIRSNDQSEIVVVESEDKKITAFVYSVTHIKLNRE
jgi:hypothetical protein